MPGLDDSRQDPENTTLQMEQRRWKKPEPARIQALSKACGGKPASGSPGEETHREVVLLHKAHISACHRNMSFWRYREAAGQRHHHTGPANQSIDA